MDNAPAWPKSLRVVFVLALTGLAISTYLTYIHFTSPASLACAENGVINCTKVTTSAQSYIMGVPVSVLGLVYFVAMVLLSIPRAACSYVLSIARLATASIGMIFVLYLLAAELLIIRSICLWCSAVHVVSFAIFVITVLTTPPLLARLSKESEKNEEGS